MDMQREDFLKLCRGPANGGVFCYDVKGRSGIGRTHDGMGAVNQTRIMDDWFPAGEIFQFLGTTCFSRGVDRLNRREPYALQAPKLRVLAPAPGGGMEEVLFSVKEVLNIARQVSIDRVNYLNGVDPKQWLNPTR